MPALTETQLARCTGARIDRATGCLPYMGRCAGLSLLAALGGVAGGVSLGLTIGLTRQQ